MLLLAAVEPRGTPGAEDSVLPTSQNTVLRSSRVQPGRSPAESPLYYDIDTSTAKFRNTEQSLHNADAFSALAPANLDSAVRAPLARSGEPRGLSSLMTARSLQDWEVENIVLLATVDGAIHARDRKSGVERWALGIPDSPMVETLHHIQNRSNDEEYHPENDYMFIVEPSKDGNLYIQHKDPLIGLQRLGVTVRALAEENPQMIEELGLVYIAGRESTFYTVDAGSGNVLKQFNKQKTFVNDNQDRSCRRISGLELENTECESAGTLQLGRVQYSITIFSARTNEPLCTIKYAEWTPNSRDNDLQSQYLAPLDDYHIQSLHNGHIIGRDLSGTLNRPYRFTYRLDTPVAQVFDVVRPLDSPIGPAQLVILPQPADPSQQSEGLLWDKSLEQSRVFVNHTESGAWYALSELSYPGVTQQAPFAKYLSGKQGVHQFLNFETDTRDLVGVHVLTPISSQISAAPLTISGPRALSDIEIPSKSEVSTVLLSPAVQQNGQTSTLIVSTMLLGVILFVFALINRSKAALQIQEYVRRKTGILISVRASTAQSGAKLKGAVASKDKTPAESATLGPAIPNLAKGSPIAIASDPLPSRSTDSYAQQDESVMLVRATDIQQDQARDQSSDGETDDEGANKENVPKTSDDSSLQEGKRRKTKRGRRGGKNNKKKKPMSPEALDLDDFSIATEVAGKDGTLVVGKLRIDTKKCLGNGSNGTAVFPGELDGRDIAVKRLIRTANSLAAKEIKHLLSSDENPHVVRYFGKEESQNFTYIALDLFTCSLDQVIEHPERYPSLIKPPEGLRVKEALRQITDGVLHLHSLKLVHRDIKPQNVLVRAIKSVRADAGPPKLQFVISDFGLCKTIDDGPESTFAPTANHTAAGTTGWRAPELLVDSRAPVAAPIAGSAGSKSASHSSDDTTVDPPTGRRATKAIDIFSLGCVFYYVMTQGHHPFDVGGTSLGRDLNIKEARYKLDHLGLFNYSFEADDLIRQMLSHDPRNRPDATTILRHPYFWDAASKLQFLCDISDRYEHEKFVSQTSAELAALDALGSDVIGKTNDFLRALPKSFIAQMETQRKYTGSRMLDLLRVIRNKKNHFHDLPEDVKAIMMGGSAEGYLDFWAKRFPSLLVNCHCLILQRQLQTNWKLEKYYT